MKIWEFTFGKRLPRVRVAGIIVSAVLALLAFGTGQAPASAAELQPPDGARQAGLTRLVFSEDFADINKAIDLKDTGNEGFSFYLRRPFGSSTISPDEVSVENGVLNMRPIAPKKGMSLLSAYKDPKNDKGFVGFAHSGAGYYEAAIAWAPWPEGYDQKENKAGFPAFWTMSAEHLFDILRDRERTPTSREWPWDYKYFENDFMEYNLRWHGRDSYLHTIHIWHHRRQPGEKGFHRRTHWNKGIKVSEGEYVGENKFHIFGCLWIPGQRVDTYFNNQLMHTFNLTTRPEFNVDGVVDHHFPIILQTGEFSLYVDWVRVWGR